ncbi:MAG: winged helix-turn-helix domain-containing protein [Paludibacteraceae bacterium]|jgi:hypothetical protein|nr:winged helix-turn-helix domain-containing protein [Paludibacteraceae bacterium]
MIEKVGKNAGLIWNALNNAGKALEAKEIKKATKLTDKDLYAAFGWLLREDKINIVEEGKEVFVNLI